MNDQDVFVNVVGGVKVVEIVVDLVLLVVMILSFCNWVLFCDFIVFGEVGLVGEIWFVFNGSEWLSEVVKYGFKCVIVLKVNVLK